MLPCERGHSCTVGELQAEIRRPQTIYRDHTVHNVRSDAR